MEGFKGTPAPWFSKPVAAAVVEGDLNIIQTNSSHGKGYHIGYVSTWGDNEQTAIEAQANASLIAAAPELLEALQLFAGEEIMAQLNGSEFVEPTDDEEWVRFRFVAKDFRKAAAAIKKALGQ